jgi:putative secretion ATPase (PEP-CTERM system associated)
MYEAHFGFTGTPFGLNPDPDFYFGSKGHAHALSYLKFGVHQGEGFVVVTGEIGAGKTTLVRTLLSGVDSERIVAAQIVSTQLEAGDLLRSVALAFGIAPKSLSKAELIATIEAFLTLLVTQGRRALLIVDEAQNLSREAVEELRMLSNFQLGNQALLQSFLVGQPELRVLLNAKPMEQFRQRVIASCHLGPMDRAETQSYIEHRLKQVGWKGTPEFGDEAHDRIFTFTGGVPRRVNLLCNRVLLSAYLNEQSVIDAALVDGVTRELRGQVAEGAAPRRAPEERPVLAGAVARGSGHRTAWQPASSAEMPTAGWAEGSAGGGDGESVLMVAACPADDVKLTMLAQALKGHAGAPPCVRLRVGPRSAFQPNDLFVARQGIDAEPIEVDPPAGESTQRLAWLLQHLPALVEARRVRAIVVVGASDAALAGGLVARRSGCRLVHVEAGWRAAPGTVAAVDGVLVERMADLLYAADAAAYLRLIREGLDDAGVHNGGSLLVDAVRAATHRPPSLETIQASLRPCDSGTRTPDLQSPFGLVLLEDAVMHGDRASVAELLSRLHPLARDLPLVWPMSAAVNARLLALDLHEQVRHEALALVEPVAFADQVALLNAAECVACDSRDVHLQASALHVRSLVLDDRWTGKAPMGEAPKPGEGPASQRIAEHFAVWWHATAHASR